jgi:hypothetical protein
MAELEDDAGSDVGSDLQPPCLCVTDVENRILTQTLENYRYDSMSVLLDKAHVSTWELAEFVTAMEKYGGGDCVAQSAFMRNQLTVPDRDWRLVGFKDSNSKFRHAALALPLGDRRFAVIDPGFSDPRPFLLQYVPEGAVPDPGHPVGGVTFTQRMVTKMIEGPSLTLTKPKTVVERKTLRMILTQPHEVLCQFEIDRDGDLKSIESSASLLEGSVSESDLAAITKGNVIDDCSMRVVQDRMSCARLTVRRLPKDRDCVEVKLLCPALPSGDGSRMFELLGWSKIEIISLARLMEDELKDLRKYFGNGPSFEKWRAVVGPMVKAVWPTFVE